MGATTIWAVHTLSRSTADLFFRLHSAMRDEDGLHADAALDELCKLLLVKMWLEEHGGPWLSATSPGEVAGAYEQAVGSILAKFEPSARGTFSDPIRLSPSCLGRCARLLEDFALRDSAVDLKGVAFQQVISAAARSGMGQYFTPEPVVDAVVKILDPKPNDRILDPFCGSGRFLTTAAKYVLTNSDRVAEYHGIDKSDRMIRIALTDMLLRNNHNIQFHCGDSLRLEEDPKQGVALESFDLVLTNPPFGSLLSDAAWIQTKFRLARNQDTPLEVLGIEQSLRFLRPGGRLAIVLPESVLNGRSSQYVRDFIGATADVLAILSLPPQTFAPFQGAAKCSVIVAEKLSGSAHRRSTVVAVARQIGYDNTNRPTENELPRLAESIRGAMNDPDVNLGDVALVLQDDLRTNLSASPALLTVSNTREETVELGSLCVEVRLGHTPPRIAYSDGDGVRILKVRDLTSDGIDWEPGPRSFVRDSFLRVSAPTVSIGDILLTSSAHNPIYIGQKVDIIDQIPTRYVRSVLFAGELLRIRVDPTKVDPYVILFWLKSPRGYAALQASIRGQSAHLHPDDAFRIRVPKRVVESASDFAHAIDMYKRALRLRHEFADQLRGTRAEIGTRLAALDS